MICDVCGRRDAYVIAALAGTLCPPCHTAHWIDVHLAVPMKDHRDPATLARRWLLQMVRAWVLQLVEFDKREVGHG